MNDITNMTSRRSFLATCAAGGAVAGMSSLAPAFATRPLQTTKLRLGLVTYNWGKDWDLATLIKNCAATGFQGVELRSTHKHGVEITLDANERDEVKAMFADSPVEIVGLGSACEYHSKDPKEVQRNIDETRAFIDLCADIGGSGVKVRPNGLPEGIAIEKTLTQIGESLTEVAKYGAEKGVQIRLEVHGRGTQEIPHMKTIMDVASHPNVVICWNCNPTDLNGAGFSENYSMLEDRMGTVHIHDLREGKNNYPWDELFPRLLQCTAPGFTGWCLLEDGAVPTDIVAAMHENKTVFDRIAMK